MKSIDFSEKFEEFDLETLNLYPEELLYIRLSEFNNLDEQVFQFIKSAADKTSQVYISIPLDLNDSSVNALRFLTGIGIRGIALRAKINADKFINQLGQGQYHAGDRDLIDYYKQIRQVIDEEFKIVFEFQVDNDFRLLGSTIVGLNFEGMEWCCLNIELNPTPDLIYKFSELFEFLRFRRVFNLNVYFPFWKDSSYEWSLKTQNTFSSLREVHLDLSNRCTHSCVFCPLYGPDSIEALKRDGKLPDVVVKNMSMELDKDRVMKIIQTLPWTVTMMQFGGNGDPLMHPFAVDFIKLAKARGIRAVEMLSNMEYLEEDQIRELHKFGGKDIHSIHFFANISGGDPDTYVQTRPKQTKKNFEKIIRNLKLFTELRNQSNGNGVHFTIMCVVNKFNHDKLLSVAKMAVELGAARIWFKPMELHFEPGRKYILEKEDMIKFIPSLKESLEYLKDKPIELMQRDYCEKLIGKDFRDEYVRS